MAQLREAGERLGVSPEELVRVGLENLLAAPEGEFDRAASAVLKKNAELYRRLA